MDEVNGTNEPEESASVDGVTDEQPIDQGPDEAQIKRERRIRATNEIKEWVKSIVVALVLALILKATVIQAYMIPTSSMEPTIVPLDRVFGNRFIYHFRGPQPGDVIAFKPPPSVFYNGWTPIDPQEYEQFYQKRLHKRETSYLKRVIAVEGDTVHVDSGRVYVNSVELDEPYLKDKSGCMGYEDFPQPTVMAGPHVIVLQDGQRQIKVPKDMVFAMGDNRCNSHDGHRWGFLPKKNIQAKAFFRFWPLKRIGMVR